MNDLQDRIVPCVMATSSVDCLKLWQEGDQQLLTRLHTGHLSEHCCRLARTIRPSRGTMQHPWRVQLYCAEYRCPIGFHLLWTITGRLAPGIAQLYRGSQRRIGSRWKRAIGGLLCWPVNLAGVSRMRCVVCWEFTGFNSQTAVVPGEQMHCTKDTCHQSIIGFVRAAFAWWALPVARPSSDTCPLPADVCRIIGHLLASMTRP